VPTILILEGDDEAATGPLSGSTGLTRRTLTVRLVLITRQDPATATISASEEMNRIIADVQKVLQVDPRRGEYAIDTTELSVNPIEADEGQPELSCSIDYSIAYRHRRTDPTIVG